MDELFVAMCRFTPVYFTITVYCLSIVDMFVLAQHLFCCRMYVLNQVTRTVCVKFSSKRHQNTRPVQRQMKPAKLWQICFKWLTYKTIYKNAIIDSKFTIFIFLESTLQQIRQTKVLLQLLLYLLDLLLLIRFLIVTLFLWYMRARNVLCGYIRHNYFLVA